ncbi:hypothetical protein [Shouchella tritolerans]|uniref:hypothetical protein n=1 Tax=Shouchella tritolerans TaxID=2979466 RepID=UPI0021E7C26C|nr:hypothetical protein [Shouchella tritolerans]
MLVGPDKIEISDEQLNKLNDTYAELLEEVTSILTDFFTPFELMQSEGIFTGESADAFAESSALIKEYLLTRFSLSLEELKAAAATFQQKINEVEPFTG